MKRMLMLMALLCLVFGGVSAQEGETEAEKLARLRKAAEDIQDADAVARAALKDYVECHGLKAKPDFAELLPKLAKRAVKKAEEASLDVRVDVGLRLHKDEYTELAKPLLEKAREEFVSTGKHVREVRQVGPDGVARLTLVPNKTFAQVVDALGWKRYEYPRIMDTCIEYDVAGAREFSVYYNYDVEEVWRDIGWFPPEVYEKLKELEATAVTAWEELKRLDEVDSFALKARKAWIRFQQAHDNKGKVDRVKGKRSFSPLAMQRETEDFDDIWTYDYAAPFMAFVEKPLGAPLPEGFDEFVQERMRLLQALFAWFSDNFIQPFDLRRVKPQYNATIAEKENWGLEVVFMKDKTTFELYCRDVMGEPIPGVHAYYSPLDERVITYNNMADDDEDGRWLQRSVLTHEAFHMLSDHYAAGPMFTREQMYERPRYSSILVQEGLTDAVAGVVEVDGEFEFYALNHLRLKDFKAIYDVLGNKVIFRLRDLVECRNYSQVTFTAIDRAKSQKINVNMNWLQNVAVGAFFAAACQAAYFFHHYENDGEHPYRQQWWGFLKDEFQGKHRLDNFTGKAGIDAFKKAFEIEEDADWDAIEKEFLEFTLALEAEDEEGGEPVEED